MKKYTIHGLAPGEAYDICLRTQTGFGPQVQQSKELKRRVLTKPMPLDWIVMEPDVNENDDKMTVLLNAPDNHSKLTGFELKLSKIVESGNNKLISTRQVEIDKNEKDNSPKDITRVFLDKLEQGGEYEVSVKARCSVEVDETQMKKTPVTTIKYMIGKKKDKSFESNQVKNITSLSTEKTITFTCGQKKNTK